MIELDLEGLDLTTARRSILDMDCRDLFAASPDRGRGRKLFKVAVANQAGSWYHVRAGGLCCYARHQFRNLDTETRGRFLRWGAAPDDDLQVSMTSDLVAAMQNRCFDVVTTAARSVERTDRHPSEELAQGVAAAIGRPYRRLFAQRTRHRERGLSWSAPESVEPARLVERVYLRSVLIVEDLVHSGATISECAGLLRECGCVVESLAYIIYR